MQGYLSNLLRNGAGPFAQSKQAINKPRASVPLQQSSLPPALEPSPQADSLFEPSLQSRREEIKGYPNESGQHAAPATNPSNQISSEYESIEKKKTTEPVLHTSWQAEHYEEPINTFSEQNQSEPRSAAILPSDPDEKTRMRWSRGFDDMGTFITQNPLDEAEQEKHFDKEESIKISITPVPDRLYEPDEVGKTYVSRQRSTNESHEVWPISQHEGEFISENLSLNVDAKGRGNDIAEQGKHPGKEESIIKVSITPVPDRLYKPDVGKANISHQEPTDENHQTWFTPPPEPTRIAQKVQEIVPARIEEIPLGGAMNNQGTFHRNENPPKLRINRLNIQIINQALAVPSKQVQRVLPHSSSLDTWEALDRHYLRRFYLTF